MVAAPLIVERPVDQGEPAQGGDRRRNPASPLALTLQSDSAGGHRIFANGQQTDEAGVRGLIPGLVAKDPELQAIVSADRGIDYGDVMHFVDLVKSLGVNRSRSAPKGAPSGPAPEPLVSRKIDLVTAAVAVVLHVGLAVTIIHGPRPGARPAAADRGGVQTPQAGDAAESADGRTGARSRRPPPRASCGESWRWSSPTRRRPRRRRNHPPATAPAFGIAMESPTVASSPVSAPVGGSTLADPARPARPNQPAAFAGGPGGASNGGFASELEIKQMPEIDTDACGKTITYPEEAERNGIEGKVRLRVALDERGHVSGVRVLSGPRPRPGPGRRPRPETPLQVHPRDRRGRPPRPLRGRVLHVQLRAAALDGDPRRLRCA